MIRRVLITVLIIAFVGTLGFVFLAWRPAITPIRPPNPASFTPEAIAKGEVLSAEGHCVSCHVRPGGEALAGGYGVNTPFGIIYGTNITPDPTTGIGQWSLAAFTRAMREGVSRDGHHLFAAFPYTAFTELSDDDINALYAAYASARHGAAEYGSLPAQHPFARGGVESSVLQEEELSARPDKEPGMEPRSLPVRGAQ